MIAAVALALALGQSGGDQLAPFNAMRIPLTSADSLACISSPVSGFGAAGTFTRATAKSIPLQSGSRTAVGPFSDANYFTLGSGADVLDFSGDFQMCVAYSPPASGSGQPIWISNATASLGYHADGTYANPCVIFFRGPGVDVTAGSNANAGAMNTCCFGRVGDTAYAQQNGGSVGTADITGWAPATATIADIGRYNLGDNNPFPGSVYEVWASTTGASSWTTMQNNALASTANGSAYLFPEDSTTVLHLRASDYHSGAVWSDGHGQSLTKVGTVGTSTVPLATSVVKCASGQLAMDANGYLAEPSGTNISLHSEAFDDAWWNKAAVGGPAAPVVTADAATAPDGTATADQIDLGTTNGANQISHIYTTAFTGTSASYTGSMWLRTVTGSGTVYLTLESATLGYTSKACSVTTTWSRCSVTKTLAANNSWLELGPNTYDGSQATNQAALSVYAWGAQSELGNAPSSYIATTSASLSHNSETLYFGSPLATNDTQWCVGATVLPGYPGNTWDGAAATQGVWEMSSGTHSGSSTPNQAQLYISSSGQPKLDIRDDAGCPGACSAALKTWTAAKPSAGSHRVTACADVIAGTVTMYVDGVAQSLTTSGTGTGKWYQNAAGTAPTRLYLGILTSTSHLRGQIKDVVIERNNVSLGSVL